MTKPEDKVELFFYILKCGKNALPCCDDSSGRQIAIIFWIWRVMC